MRPVLYSCLLAVTLLSAPVVWAQDHATPDEAKALAIKAAAYLKEVGPDKAFPDFNHAGGPWIDRDLYVIVSDKDHTVLADGGNASLIGHDTSNLKDVDGVPIAQLVAAIKDAGWVKYKWRDPMTHTVEPKEVYWVIVGNFNVGVGAYVK